MYVTDRGFAVSTDAKPYMSFHVWKDEDFLNKNVASLKPIVFHVIQNTLKSCEEFVETITEIIEFPPSLLKDNNYIFIRSDYTKGFVDLCKSISNGDRWWN